MGRKATPRTAYATRSETFEHRAPVGCRRPWRALDAQANDRDGVGGTVHPEVPGAHVAYAIRRRRARYPAEPGFADLTTSDGVPLELRRRNRTVLDIRPVDPYGRVGRPSEGDENGQRGHHVGVGHALAQHLDHGVSSTRLRSL